MDMIDVIIADGHTSAALKGKGMLKGDKGDKGDPGPQGPPGDDGSDGIGIADVGQNQNHNLLITLTDGNVLNAGELPAGPQGPQGDDYVLTAQDKSDIAALVIAGLPIAEEQEV